MRSPRSVLVALLLVLASAQAASAAQTRAFVYATDFGSGAISTVELGPPRTAVIDRASVCSDAVIRYFFGQLYVVERFGCNSIRILDPVTFNVVRQFSTGNNSNPNDICVISPTKAYVTRYDQPDLWIMNPATGGFLGSISLAPFADHDGIPEMNRMVRHGNHVFVTCQRLDRDNFFSPTDSSLVVVIDATTDAIVDADPDVAGAQGILLPRTNPTTEFATTPHGDFLLGCTGAFGVTDGGVVRLDPLTLSAKAVEVTEAQLGGDINDVAVGTGSSGATRAFCVVSDAAFNTKLVSYHRSGAVTVTTVFPGSGFVLADVEVDDRDEVYLCDRTASAPGVRVFAALTGVQLTASAIGTGLPPSDIAFDATEPVGVPEAALAAGPVEFLGAFPNPAPGASLSSIRLRTAGPGTVNVAIVNAAGRTVRAWRSEANGDCVVAWDGRDAMGRAAPSGVYLVRATLECRPGIATGRLVRLAPTRL
jgi:hypothetical protein